MKKLKLSAKVTLLFVLFALVLCLAISLLSYFMSYDTYCDFYSRKAQDTADLAATFIDGDRIGSYLETMEPDEYYYELRETLSTIKRKHPDVSFLYVFVPAEDHFTYIVEAEIETDDPGMIAGLGDVFEYTELEYKYLLPDVAAKKASTQTVIKDNLDEFGEGVEAWSPVFDSSGELAAMVEADVTVRRIHEMLSRYVVTITLLSSAIILVMVVLLAMINRRIVTRPLKKLTRNALELASEDALGRVDDILTGDEMQTLNEALKKMAGDIERYSGHLASLAAERERIATEMNVAVDIRKSLLPKPFKPDAAFGVSALLNSAREVGGDFYDYFFIDARRVCVVIANVAGRGIPAALFMVVAKTIIKNQMMANLPVEEAMGLINARMYESNPGNMSVSAFVGVLEKNTGSFSYVNAGGEAPLILRRGGSFDFLGGAALSVLAENKNVEYRPMDLQLRQGDKLFFYSHGVLALEDQAGRVLDKETLRELLNSTRPGSKTAEELLREVNNELRVFSDDFERSGDATALCLTYDKGDRKLSELSVPPRADSFKRVLPFIKNQLSENGIGGAFYAGAAIALEELFVIAAGRTGGGEPLNVRCGVNGIRVELTLFYGGNLNNPLESPTPAEHDALVFVRKYSDELNYSVREGKNVLTLVKLLPED